MILEGVCWKYPPIHHHNERVLSFIHAICVVIYWRRQSRFVQFCASNDTNQLFENVEILYIRGSTQPSTLRDPANTYNLIRMTNTENKINGDISVVDSRNRLTQSLIGGIVRALIAALRCFILQIFSYTSGVAVRAISAVRADRDIYIYIYLSGM